MGNRCRRAMSEAGVDVTDIEPRDQDATWRCSLADALAGRRRMSSLGVALVSDATGADIDWLITGKAPAL